MLVNLLHVLEIMYGSGHIYFTSEQEKQVKEPRQIKMFLDAKQVLQLVNNIVIVIVIFIVIVTMTNQSGSRNRKKLS